MTTTTSPQQATPPQAEVLRLGDIVVDVELQTREDGLNDHVVAEYAEQMAGEASAAAFPPLDVFRLGDGSYLLASGFHRHAAAERAGLDSFRCQVHQGTRAEAVLHAAGSNVAHGLRRTNADKRRAVVMLLESVEWTNKADNWIANACGVSHPFVGQVRSQLVTVTSSGPREGRDGKTRRLPIRTESADRSSPSPGPGQEFDPLLHAYPGTGSATGNNDEASAEEENASTAAAPDQCPRGDQHEPDLLPSESAITTVAQQPEQLGSVATVAADVADLADCIEAQFDALRAKLSALSMAVLNADGERRAAVAGLVKEACEQSQQAVRFLDFARDATKAAMGLPVESRPAVDATTTVEVALPPAHLFELVDAFNSLGPAIVAAGNGVRRNTLSKAVLSGYKRAQKDPELREALRDIPKLMAAIRAAPFVHRKPWFTLPWLFGKNQDGELKVARIIAGGYTNDGRRDSEKTGGRGGLRGVSNAVQDVSGGELRSVVGAAVPGAMPDSPYRVAVVGEAASERRPSTDVKSQGSA